MPPKNEAVDDITVLILDRSFDPCAMFMHRYY